MELLLFLDLAGTLAFAISGAFRAVKHELDILGVFILALATGVGGGLIRDTLLGATPAAALTSVWYLPVCLFGSLAVFLAAPRIAPHWNMVLRADAVGLGVFAGLGAAKALAFGLGPMGVILIAGLSAVGGGVIRDLLVCEIPAVLRTGFYASAALLGGATYYGLILAGAPEIGAFLACAVLTTGSRFLALHGNWNLPRVRRLPDSPSTLSNQRRRRGD